MYVDDDWIALQEPILDTKFLLDKISNFLEVLDPWLENRLNKRLTETSESPHSFSPKYTKYQICYLNIEGQREKFRKIFQQFTGKI